jgi:ubiquinone/menaquinone biosynthesis C-methylase UbiE
MTQGEHTSVDVKERQRVEEEFHDAKARIPKGDFYRFGAIEQANRCLREWIGDVKGKVVLEIGCGEGETIVQFADAGAIVHGIDISQEMVERAIARAEENGVRSRITVVQMGGEELEFPDESVDIVFGQSVLHHLSIDLAMKEIRRVLRPGGSAFFLEPLDHNPIVAVFRRLTPQRRTPTERPLSQEQIMTVGSRFSYWAQREFYLFSLLAFFWYYVIRSEKLFRSTLTIFSWFDEWIFKRFPSSRRYAWVTILQFTRSGCLEIEK